MNDTEMKNKLRPKFWEQLPIEQLNKEEEGESETEG